MLFCLSINHHNAPLHVREALAVTTCQQEDWFNHLPKNVEAVLLSTCNRIELYLEAPSPKHATAEWHRLMGGRIERAEQYTQMHTGKDAARYLFRVAAGLESVVLGEPEILGQVTRAYEDALERGSLGAKLSIVFRAAIHTAKVARTETSLSQGSISFISLAIRRIEEERGSLMRDLRTLVIGAGEMGTAVLSGLKSREATNVVVMSRTMQRAMDTAAEFGFEAAPIECIREEIHRADVIFTATAAPHAIIVPTSIEARTKPLHCVDLAIPRDIDPTVAGMQGVRLFNLEDLEHGINTTYTQRESAATEAETIIEQALTELMMEYQARDVATTITQMRQWANDIRQDELQRIMNRLPSNHEDYTPYLEEFSHRLLNKLLHHPTISLREHAEDPQYETIMRSLFGLDNE